MKKVLAVSGGIDSMVLLHIYRNDPEAIVAHFDHGIRECSAMDSAFVRRIAEQYCRPFYCARAELGKNSSEEAARKARYAFLKDLCRKHSAKLFTAHHADDAAETIAINLLRGTGWRGIAPFGDNEIVRPLLKWNKARLYRYATENQVRFRADSTNNEDKYLRNRVRRWLYENPSVAKKLKKQFENNSQIRAEIEQLELELISPQKFASREFYQELDDLCALELLRQQLLLWGISLTRPQLERTLRAIRALSAGKSFSLNRQYQLKIERYYFRPEKQG